MTDDGSRFIEGLINLAMSTRERGRYGAIIRVVITSEMGIAIDLPPGQTMMVHTPAGPIEIESAEARL